MHMIGPVGALFILQGATYVYESLFGKIQPSQEKFTNLTAKQRRKRRKIERRKAVAAGRASLEGELQEETSQVSSTGLAEVTTGASSSSDPVEGIGQISTAQAQATKHQRTSQSKDQPKKESTQTEQSQICQLSASRKKSKEKDPKKPRPDNANDSVPSTSSEIHPKKQSTHKEQGLTSKADATKTLGKGKEPKKPSSDNATSNKDQTMKPSIQKDQRSTCEAVVDKKGGKEKKPKKHTCDNAKKNTLTLSSKEQPKKQSAQQDQGSSSEADPGKKRGKVMESKKPSRDNVKKNVPTTLKKDQAKKESTPEDQLGSTCEAVVGKKDVKGKYPKKHTCGNAKKNVPTITSIKVQPQKQSALQDQGSTCEADAGKKGGKVMELKKPSCDIAKKNVSTTSMKNQPKKQTLEDEGMTFEAKKGCKGKEPKKTSSDSTRKTDPTTSSKEYTKKESTQKDQGPTCKAHAGKKGSKGKETKKIICDNPNKCVPATSIKEQFKKDKDQHKAGKNKGKEKEPKKLSPDNLKDMGVPTTLSKEQPKQQSSQKYQCSACVADAGKEGRQEKEVKSKTDKEENTLVTLIEKTPDQCLTKMREISCLPGDSKEAIEQFSNPIKVSDSEWTLVGKYRTTKNKEKKTGPSEKCQAGPKKTPATQIRVQKKTQLQTSAEPSQAKSGNKDQKAEDAPRKKRPTRRAKKKPKKGKPKPNVATTATEESLPECPQEQCPTKMAEAPKTVVSTWANILKSKPNINTPSLQNESKAPENQDEETLKETEAAKSLTETPWNVPVTYKKCIGRKKKALCVKQESIIASSIIVEPLTESSGNATMLDNQNVQSYSQPPPKEPSATNSAITQEVGMKDSATMSVTMSEKQEVQRSLQPPANESNIASPVIQEAEIKDFADAAVSDTQEVAGSSILRANQPNTDFPITQEVMKSFADIATPDQQEVTGSSPSSPPLANQPYTDFPITQEAEMKESVLGPKTEKPISAPLVKQDEELHKDVLDLFIPNFPVKLEEEREEEDEKKSAEHHNAALPIKHQEQWNSIPSMIKPLEQSKPKHQSTGIAILANTTIQTGEPSTLIKIIPAVSEPLEQRRLTDEATTTKILISTATQTDEHELQAVKSLMAAAPVHQAPTDQMVTVKSEVHKSVPVPSSQGVPPTKLPQMSAFSPACIPSTATTVKQQQISTSPAINPAKALVTYIEDPKIPAVQALMATTPVQRGPTDHMLTVKSEVQKSVPVRYPQKVPTANLSQISTFTTALGRYPAVPVIQQYGNAYPAVNSQANLVKYVEYPQPCGVNSLVAVAPVQTGLTGHMPTVQSEVQKSVPMRYPEVVPTTNLSQMPAFHPTYASYPAAPVLQQHGYTYPAAYPQTTQVTYVEDPTTLQHGTTYYQNYNYLVPTTKTWQIGYASTSYNAYSTSAPVLRQAIMPPIVKPYIHQTCPVVSLGAVTTNKVPEKVPTRNVKNQPTKRNPGFKQDLQRSAQVILARDAPNTTKTPRESPMPSATCMPKTSGSQIKKQQTNITPPVKEVKETVQVKSQKIGHTANIPPENVSPKAANIPKEATSLAQIININPTVKQDLQRPNQVKRAKVTPSTNKAPLGKASPTATETPKATATMRQEQ